MCIIFDNNELDVFRAHPVSKDTTARRENIIRDWLQLTMINLSRTIPYLRSSADEVSSVTPAVVAAEEGCRHTERVQGV